MPFFNSTFATATQRCSGIDVQNHTVYPLLYTTLTFDLLTSMVAEGLPWTIYVPTLVLIAQAFTDRTDRQTDTDSNRRNQMPDPHRQLLRRGQMPLQLTHVYLIFQNTNRKSYFTVRSKGERGQLSLPHSTGNNVITRDRSISIKMPHRLVEYTDRVHAHVCPLPKLPLPLGEFGSPI